MDPKTIRIITMLAAVHVEDSSVEMGNVAVSAKTCGVQ